MRAASSAATSRAAGAGARAEESAGSPADAGWDRAGPGRRAQAPREQRDVEALLAAQVFGFGEQVEQQRGESGPPQRARDVAIARAHAARAAAMREHDHAAGARRGARTRRRARPRRRECAPACERHPRRPCPEARPRRGRTGCALSIATENRRPAGRARRRPRAAQGSAANASRTLAFVDAYHRSRRSCGVPGTAQGGNIEAVMKIRNRPASGAARTQVHEHPPGAGTIRRRRARRALGEPARAPLARHRSSPAAAAAA